MKTLILLVVIVLSLVTLQAIKLHDESGIADESDVEIDGDDVKPTDSAEPKVQDPDQKNVDEKDAEKKTDDEEEKKNLPKTTPKPNVSMQSGSPRQKVSKILDAFNDENCTIALNYTEEQMIKNIEYFSRNLTPELFDDAQTIFNNISELNPQKKYKFPLIHTYELYDKAFEFKRVRNYELTTQNLDVLEHFEDNLNVNPTNRQNLANYIRVATQVRANLNEKYGGADGVFTDPATIDPYNVDVSEVKDWSLDEE